MKRKVYGANGAFKGLVDFGDEIVYLSGKATDDWMAKTPKGTWLRTKERKATDSQVAWYEFNSIEDVAQFYLDGGFDLEHIPDDLAEHIPSYE